LSDIAGVRDEQHRCLRSSRRDDRRRRTEGDGCDQRRRTHDLHDTLTRNANVGSMALRPDACAVVRRVASRSSRTSAVVPSRPQEAAATGKRGDAAVRVCGEMFSVPQRLRRAMPRYVRLRAVARREPRRAEFASRRIPLSRLSCHRPGAGRRLAWAADAGRRGQDVPARQGAFLYFPRRAAIADARGVISTAPRPSRANHSSCRCSARAPRGCSRE